MKDSEYLRKRAEEDDNDNDWRGFMWGGRIIKAERFEKFEEKVIPKLEGKGYEVETAPNGGFHIYTDVFGKLTYYPKSNSTYSHKNKKWYKDQWVWIKYNLLNLKYFDKL